ncbi:hypothetical protein V6N13_082498 [Hibiscus sabdariffa]|uniref:Uncharacterized protein n=2 Tax=Hibiscus sabdariffa TaxID=183260 RepID=A0ABR2A9E4_9ROSI
MLTLSLTIPLTIKAELCSGLPQQRFLLLFSLSLSGFTIFSSGIKQTISSATFSFLFPKVICSASIFERHFKD